MKLNIKSQPMTFGICLNLSFDKNDSHVRDSCPDDIPLSYTRSQMPTADWLDRVRRRHLFNLFPQ